MQLKGRLCFYKKYLEHDIWMAFPTSRGWYLYPHDTVLELVASQTNIQNTDILVSGYVDCTRRDPSSLPHCSMDAKA